MPKTLLAVDDSATMRKVLEITFSGEDYRIVTADSAQTAIAKLSEEPRVFVIDTALGGDDGYALSRGDTEARRLRSHRPPLEPAETQSVRPCEGEGLRRRRLHGQAVRHAADGRQGEERRFRPRESGGAPVAAAPAATAGRKARSRPGAGGCRALCCCRPAAAAAPTPAAAAAAPRAHTLMFGGEVPQKPAPSPRPRAGGGRPRLPRPPPPPLPCRTAPHPRPSLQRLPLAAEGRARPGSGRRDSSAARRGGRRAPQRSDEREARRTSGLPAQQILKGSSPSPRRSSSASSGRSSLSSPRPLIKEEIARLMKA